MTGGTTKGTTTRAAAATVTLSNGNIGDVKKAIQRRETLCNHNREQQQQQQPWAFVFPTSPLSWRRPRLHRQQEQWLLLSGLNQGHWWWWWLEMWRDKVVAAKILRVMIYSRIGDETQGSWGCQVLVLPSSFKIKSVCFPLLAPPPSKNIFRLSPLITKQHPTFIILFKISLNVTL